MHDRREEVSSDVPGVERPHPDSMSNAFRALAGVGVAEEVSPLRHLVIRR